MGGPICDRVEPVPCSELLQGCGREHDNRGIGALGRKRWPGGWSDSGSTLLGPSRSPASYVDSVQCFRWTSRLPSSPSEPDVRVHVPVSSRWLWPTEM